MAALADAGATTVVYMGKRTFAALSKMLMDHGLPGDTPAMLAEGVSTHNQRIDWFTIKTLAEHLSDGISTQPALILYGPLARDL